MSKFALFNEIRAGACRSDASVSNRKALGMEADCRSIHILWMYPDVLNMHGGRGDVMALLHYSNLMKLPCTIRRINLLTEEIPFDWADMIFFPSGGLSCMTDVNLALSRYQADFQRFAESGKTVVAIGSSGALLAENTVFMDGKVSPGLGLLQMDMTQREKVFGDDLWITTDDGLEVVSSEIQMSDVSLHEGQTAFGQVRYGRGNCGDGKEGARTGNVIFTHCLGPVLVRNPRFAEFLLQTCADRAEIPAEPLRSEDISLEMDALKDIKTFIEKKIRGEIHG